MASFQSKIRWRRPRKRENENYCSDPFLHNPQLKIKKKIAAKFVKVINTHMASFQAIIGWTIMRQRENKNSKKIVKKFKKIKKYHYGVFSSQN